MVWTFLEQLHHGPFTAVFQPEEPNLHPLLERGDDCQREGKRSEKTGGSTDANNQILKGTPVQVLTPHLSHHTHFIY